MFNDCFVALSFRRRGPALQTYRVSLISGSDLSTLGYSSFSRYRLVTGDISNIAIGLYRFDIDISYRIVLCWSISKISINRDIDIW